MSRKQYLYCAAVTLLSLITACAPPKTTTELSNIPNAKNAPSPTPLKETVSKQQTSTITRWETSGAIAARNNKKGWTASFTWAQQGSDHYQIRLFGPLGGGTVLIEHQPGVTTFRDGPKVTSATNADTLLKQKTGVMLPVNHLYYWARGLTAPGTVKAAQYDAQHQLKFFQQAGYTIEYLSYMDVNGVRLPKQIKLQGNGVMIKVAIKQWKF